MYWDLNNARALTPSINIEDVGLEDEDAPYSARSCT